MKLLKCKVQANGYIGLELQGIGDSQLSLVFTIQDLKDFIEWKNADKAEQVEDKLEDTSTEGE